MSRLLPCFLAVCLIAGSMFRSGWCAEPILINLWPGVAPGDKGQMEPEHERPRPNDRLVAGKTVRRIQSVSVPQLAIYRPSKPASSKGAVIICPGGAHNILAYDLEGTEVAEWLASEGVTGIVLKYRVPARDPDNKAKAPVQDAQRAISLIRSRAAEFDIDPTKIGLLGFSAGGEVAARTCLTHASRQYDTIDKADSVSCRPDFGTLIYPAYLVDRETQSLLPNVTVPKDAPPMFMVHAWDDNVTPLSSILLAAELKKANVRCELHVFPTGGHGYGLRHVDGFPVTDWPVLYRPWLQSILTGATATAK